MLVNRISICAEDPAMNDDDNLMTMTVMTISIIMIIITVVVCIGYTIIKIPCYPKKW